MNRLWNGEYRHDDLQVVIFYTSTDYNMEFKVVSIMGTDLDSNVTYYGEDCAVTEEDPHKVKSWMHGGLKWDGCINWQFTDEEVMVHFCGRADAARLGRVLDLIYDLGQKTIGGWDAEVAS